MPLENNKYSEPHVEKKQVYDENVVCDHGQLFSLYSAVGSGTITLNGDLSSGQTQRYHPDPKNYICIDSDAKGSE